MSDAPRTAAYVGFIDGADLWRKAERMVICNCGLIAVGYSASWAVSHTERCPVTEAYRVLFTDAVRAAAEASRG